MLVTIAIFFAVRFIVTVLIADDVSQRKAVMCGNQVDARSRPSAARLKNIGGAVDPPGQVTTLLRVTAPETTHRVTIIVVPLGPAVREITELVAAGTGVPGLGDQFGRTQRGVRGNCTEQWV